MIELDDYILLVIAIDKDIKVTDKMSAYNIIREISVIYQKTNYLDNQVGVKERLSSLIDYIKKTIPVNSENVVMILNNIISKMKTP